ncbi:GtrA family protein [Streptomyces sp. ISL-100]|uniref:GtrA family protein n=1 Tax=Streptomyces sp. ISL-100 TaxID=2819173 RepID=UPI001BEBD0B1|nr:GtrA family protein [Streptomyces sp. ISL-100]MBT2394957.1 GtrA family protein [Streptomyces sp. ISL-100]
MKARGLRQFAAFAAIGVVNTAVYYAVYASLNIWMPYLVAHGVGWAVSIVGSFLLNSYVTLRTKPTWRAFFRYPLSAVANVVGSGILLYVAVSRLGMPENISALAAGVLVTPLSFLLARWAITSGAAATRASEAQAQAQPQEAEQEVTEADPSK